MSFQIPSDGTLDQLSVSALQELRAAALNEHTSIRASATAETVTDDQVATMDEIVAFIGKLDERLDAAEARAAAYNAEIPARPAKTPEVTEVQASAPAFNDEGVKDVKDEVKVADADNLPTTVVAATVTHSTAVTSVADVAAYAPAPATPEGSTPKVMTLVASNHLSTGSRNAPVSNGAEMDWNQFAQAFQETSASNFSRARSGGPATREHTRIASLRREATEDRVLLGEDDAFGAYNKLKAVSDRYSADITAGNESLVAANGFCTPSLPIYTTCSPIEATNLWSGPRVVASRGGVIHNQGLDFADFFGGDFVLPIPGYNALTEAQVIADTAKTCFEIPCPPFVDDRLNIAALCLTGSILQNRTYPEFVSTFVEGSIAAMAHLVNREIINAIEAGATSTTALAALDPWASDGSVLSQVMSAVEMAVMDLRYAYRTSANQVFEVLLPVWLKAQLRADYIRQNARVSEDLADSLIDQMFRTRGAMVQWLYDWQDAFNPTGALPAVNQAGNATPVVGLPIALEFIVYLPGTWVLAELDIIRLDMVYDSTLLAQNQVTQLFMEDGFKPMRMCSFSRNYTINICPNGSTGVQRAVDCVNP
jgi:hypothetical protein